MRRFVSLLLIGFTASAIAAEAPKAEPAKAVDPAKVAAAIKAEEVARVQREAAAQKIREEAARNAPPPPAGLEQLRRAGMPPPQLCLQAPDGSLGGCLVWRRKGKRWVLEFTGDTAKSAQLFFARLNEQAEAFLLLGCPASDYK